MTKSMRLPARLAWYLCLVPMLLAGQGAAAETIRVTIDGLAFAPDHVTAKAGDTIEWVNHDFIDHTATAKDGSWDVPLPAGKTAELKLKSTGTFT